MNKAQVIKKLKAKGYDDDCTPNYLEEIAKLMIDHAKPYKKAIELIKQSFPENILDDQMGEQYNEFLKLSNK